MAASYQPKPPPGADGSFPFEWSHNHAAWVGVIVCIFLLWLWRDRNIAYFTQRRRDYGD